MICSDLPPMIRAALEEIDKMSRACVPPALRAVQAGLPRHRHRGQQASIRPTWTLNDFIYSFPRRVYGSITYFL